MAADRLLDLVCFSYLADAQVMHVDTYPLPNSGAAVDATAASIAGDGPLTAITAARLGLRTGLIANSVGADHTGQRLRGWLDHFGVDHNVHAVAGTATPHLTVIADRGTRTWFAALTHAYADLLTADLALLTRTRLAYIDCYHVIADAAARAVAAAQDTPLLLNLGGDQPSPDVIAAARSRRLLTVQTSVDDSAVDSAADVADTLFHLFAPHTVVVTVGRHGAFARTRHQLHRVAAPEAAIHHTHGAGAAFSAGYARAILTGADIDTALTVGCNAGTQHCASPAALVPRQIPADVLTTV
ncbi:carbohydrate kinase family protein [Actinoplanes sp. NPDC049118]|uniref:carbohydrate kinase family protein n=1 Tax=Actinoplanes sp. NPDC049118 TaxID=3155769 RepID=UPI0033C77DFB